MISCDYISTLACTHTVLILRQPFLLRIVQFCHNVSYRTADAFLEHWSENTLKIRLASAVASDGLQYRVSTE